MAIQPETVIGRKEHFRRKRAEFVATWTTDESGIVHIPFENGMEAIFNAKHFEIASQFMWRPKKNKDSSDAYYVEACVVEELRHLYGSRTSLHRVIAGNPLGLEVDHENHNGLDCTDDNIRIATRGQNQSNRLFNNSLGYRGICRNGKNKRLGTFARPVDAARAYNAEAERLFGEFAILNKIEEMA